MLFLMRPIDQRERELMAARIDQALICPKSKDSNSTFREPHTENP